ncbi:MAG: 1-acyl-sn-glycerol-3-phosphate acyltransferase [Actinomycetota bacterium]
MIAPVLQTDVGDCEAADGGLFEQDANAWTSLAFVVVGLLLLEALRRRRMRPVVATLAVAMIAEGVGSVLFHGVPSDGAKLVHDVALLALVVHLAAWHVGRLRGRATADRAATVATVAAAIVGTAVHLVAPELVSNVAFSLVAVIVGAEVVARRRRLGAVWTNGLLVLSAIAIGTWLLGRTDSPTCDPAALTQPHAVWHLLSAFVVLVWADATAGSAPTGRAGWLRDGVDLALGRLAGVLTFAFHRRPELLGADRLPSRGPVLIVANHGNGFVDPVIVAAVLGRLPRFIAKAALWKVPPARPLLAFAGVIPVYRRSDGDDVTSNRSSFAAVHDALAGGGTVAIFPEGTTGDRAALDRVRTGAARMAIGAVVDAPELLVVPIGLAFESRVETRSAVAVVVGDPIPVRSWLRETVGEVEVDEDDRAVVQALTVRIRVALTSVSPEFASVDERELLRATAEVEVREAAPANRDPSFGRVELRARQLAAAPEPARRAIIDRYRSYATRLSLLGLRDADLEDGVRARQAAPALAALVVVAVAGSLVIATTVVHLPAALLVVATTGWVRSTATKGTVRLLVGAAAGLSTWIIVGVVVADGWAAVAVGAGVAVGGAIALVVWSTLVRAVGRLIGRARARGRQQLADRARAERAELVGAVRAATAAQGDGPD